MASLFTCPMCSMKHEPTVACLMAKPTPKPVPWVPYENTSLRSVTLCEETGQQAVEARCPVHGGDACLYVYRHPYDNEADRWKKDW